jgi:hypothetical protein
LGEGGKGADGQDGDFFDQFEKDADLAESTIDGRFAPMPVIQS